MEEDKLNEIVEPAYGSELLSEETPKVSVKKKAKKKAAKKAIVKKVVNSTSVPQGASFKNVHGERVAILCLKDGEIATFENLQTAAAAKHRYGGRLSNKDGIIRLNRR